MEGFKLKEQDERLDYGSKKMGFTLRLQKGRGVIESI
jgi:hypothetical protein